LTIYIILSNSSISCFESDISISNVKAPTVNSSFIMYPSLPQDYSPKPPPPEAPPQSYHHQPPPPHATGVPAQYVAPHSVHGNWSSSLCACCSDVPNCCLTCWCPCITFGQIAEIVDKGNTSCGVHGGLYALIEALICCGCISGVNMDYGKLPAMTALFTSVVNYVPCVKSIVSSNIADLTSPSDGKVIWRDRIMEYICHPWLPKECTSCIPTSLHLHQPLHRDMLSRHDHHQTPPMFQLHLSSLRPLGPPDFVTVVSISLIVTCGVHGVRYALINVLTCCGCLYSCTYRTKMRRQQGLPEAPTNDCCVHFCCGPCALCQEYRELQHRGFDMSIGWQESMDRSMPNGIQIPPVTHGGMNHYPHNLPPSPPPSAPPHPPPPPTQYATGIPAHYMAPHPPVNVKWSSSLCGCCSDVPNSCGVHGVNMDCVKPLATIALFIVVANDVLCVKSIVSSNTADMTYPLA
ncbi:Uncharacterized protein family Cys-rich, partial [Cynara cardunculus var. scolymus]